MYIYIRHASIHTSSRNRHTRTHHTPYFVLVFWSVCIPHLHTQASHYIQQPKVFSNAKKSRCIVQVFIYTHKHMEWLVLPPRIHTWSRSARPHLCKQLEYESKHMCPCAHVTGFLNLSLYTTAGECMYAFGCICVWFYPYPQRAQGWDVCRFLWFL